MLKLKLKARFNSVTAGGEGGGSLFFTFMLYEFMVYGGVYSSTCTNV